LPAIAGEITIVKEFGFMDIQTFREKLMLTVLSGLMLRHNEPGYSDGYAVEEAYRISKKWCDEFTAPTTGQGEAGRTARQHGHPAICAFYPSTLCHSQEFNAPKCRNPGSCPHKQQAGA
jgi:hypothetical protein